LSSVVTTYPIPVADSNYWSSYDSRIVAGPKGDFWFTDSTNNAIGEVTPAGKVTEFALPVHNVNDGSGTLSPDNPDPTNIVVGSDGNLWFTESGVDRIGRITPAGVITEFTTPTADSNPTGLALGADGDVWFGESATGGIAKITPTGKITEYSLLSYTIDYGDSLAAGPDGNIWFLATDSSGNGAIGSITPSGKLNFLPLDDNASAITTFDGALWVADGSAIERVATSGTTTSFSLPDDSYNSVGALAVGTDGNLYFTINGNASFGKITSAGAITEYALPNDSSGNTINIADLAQAPDGRFWYVDSYTPEVGVIDLTNALLATGDSANVTAGSSQTTTVGSFVDLSGSSVASDYTATLTLSDGTVIDGTIAANSSGGFDVSVTHTWTIGFNNATLTVTDTRSTSRVATATSYIQATAPLAVGTGVDITAAAGQSFSGTVASFTNVDLSSLSSYSASIDWGDGHITAGTITANNSGGIDVSGTNDYAQSGTFTVTTTLLPYDAGIYRPGGPIGVVPVVQPVSTPIASLTGTLSSILGYVGLNGGAVSTSGGSLSGGVSSVIGAIGGILGIKVPGSTGGSPGSTGGGSSSGAIALPPIWFGGGGASSATSTATISAGVMQGTGYSVQVSSKTSFSGDVASFTLTDPSADLSHYHATVEYNDPGISNWWFTLSNAPTAGVITSNGNGGFTVSTSTQFTNPGLYHFAVKITDDRLGTGDAAVVGVAYGQAIVDSPNIWLPIYNAGAGSATVAGAVPTGSAEAATPNPSNPAFGEHVKVTPASINTAAGKAFSGTVGTLKGIVSGANNVASLHGTINWGDGTTSVATFVAGKKGVIAIKGSHTYTAGGKQAVSIDISQTLYNKGTASTLYPLHLPKIHSAAHVAGARHSSIIITTGGIAITATAGATFTANVASFTAPAVDPSVTRTAEIWWGDATHSTGTLSTNGNVLTVSGTHAYKKAGKYKTRVEVIQTTPQGSHKV